MPFCVDFVGYGIVTPRYDLPIARLPWEVPVSGYRWAEDSGRREHARQKYLVAVESGPVRFTDPAVDQPALYRVFAATPPTPEGFKAFADAHGTLGVTLDVAGWYDDEPVTLEWPMALEPHFGGLGGLEAGDAALLDRHLEVNSPPRGSDTPSSEAPRSDPVIRSAVRDVRDRLVFHQLRYGDPLTVWRDEHARMLKAVQLLDWAGRDAITPADAAAIRVLANQALGGPDVRLVLTPTRTTRKPALHICPLNLLGLMWVQFALAVTGSRDHRHCGGCGRWFEVSAEHGHGKQGYCTAACKARAYRGRKARARKLAADGLTLSQIAADVGSSNKIVRGWVRDVATR